jgi:hypothetical protein
MILSLHAAVSKPRNVTTLSSTPPTPKLKSECAPVCKEHSLIFPVFLKLAQFGFLSAIFIKKNLTN